MNKNIESNTSSWGVPPLASVTVSETIIYKVASNGLGEVLVARSHRGICAILIGTDAGQLKNELAKQFPKASIEPDMGTLHGDVAKVVSFIENPKKGLNLTLDMRGTPFQLRVWDALRTIPAGATVTYTELARWIGHPKSIRAVAAACASNVIALAVPCHRALRKGGALAGYRWGIERKQALLEKEAGL